ncbi:hypothetical protein [Deminuibacter soli]|uniref:Uncharacterized protein n=1 Tax=Deminuibacter soli TaxID=2291815 RepID=A0A3E1NQE2_9BACT|nr:hypothetical protein [Deminuibacter soli]RFM30034.1 hypothetical protein DXN05_03420 [Deminuibacter soli]
MDELFLYDRDKGLFKQLLLQSSVMQGRYHVSPDYGYDLNTNNLGAYISDPASGSKTPLQKYPLCVCITPRSRLVKVNGADWEQFSFTLFFLCKSFVSGTNQLKAPDAATNTSKHQVWEDWKDMKECAGNFWVLLQQVILKSAALLKGVPVSMRSVLNVDFDRPAEIARISRFGSDDITGVSLQFLINMYADGCQLNDYPDDVLNKITVPPLEIHPIHKH